MVVHVYTFLHISQERGPLLLLLNLMKGLLKDTGDIPISYLFWYHLISLNAVMMCLEVY